jgi:hypothetical protein
MTYDYRIEEDIGPHCDAGDAQRNWVARMQTTDRRSLSSYAPWTRRQAEWDDHGEAYPLNHDGPNLVVRIRLPDAVHRISLYFVNFDGQKDPCSLRDYLVELRRDGAQDAETTAVSRARITNFWGGVYHQFIVSGQGAYTITIHRSGSLNTICSGVFIDRLAGPPPREEKGGLSELAGARYDAPELPEWAFYANNPVMSSALLCIALDEAWGHTAALFSLSSYRVLGARSAYPSRDRWNEMYVARRLRWRLALWSPADHVGYQNAIAEGMKIHKQINSKVVR